MWLTLLDFKIGDEPLAREMDTLFLDALPTRRICSLYLEILNYLAQKGYRLHLITNGFEKVQHSKLEHAGLTKYFERSDHSEGSNASSRIRRSSNNAFCGKQG